MMRKTLEEKMQLAQWNKKLKHVVCIDSDGTALDTMNIKHIRCFGPCFVETFGLRSHKEEMLARWNAVNLFEKTRGKNRFITLLQILREYNGRYFSYDLSAFAAWVESGTQLSGRNLRSVAEASGDETELLALRWSDAVDAAIAQIAPEEKRPFDGVENFLKGARGRADIAVVSSAGAVALREEWARFGLDGYVDVMTSQEDGSKEDCIKALIAKGYAPREILMIGDSFPDIEAAKDSGVWFYPILAGKEKESWEALVHTYFDAFLGGRYAEVQGGLCEAFYNNLNVKN